MIKCTSRRKYKRALMLAGETAKRWLKRPQNGSKKEQDLANKFDKATTRLYQLNYTYIEQ